MKSRQLFIQDPVNKSIRFTRAGIDKYRADFGAVGYDITKIRTMSAFEKAVDDSFAFKMRKLSLESKGQDNELDNLLNSLPGWD